ncbi:MAG: response regulator transcription factor [Bifidobacteriaceae bacterium]|jgi:DNA-binding NarL/FixJ family response regulator|nr:response regulator transcription factor [Bifidobacteriaceae bacterium]
MLATDTLQDTPTTGSDESAQEGAAAVEADSTAESPKGGGSAPAPDGGVHTITVLVADDHPIVRNSLVDLLAQEPDIKVVAVAGTGEEAVRLALETAPDVVMMDLKMPGQGGVWATSQILADAAGSGRDTKVVAVTALDSDAGIVQAVRAGVSEYVLKASPPEVFAEAVRRAAAGTSKRSPEVQAAFANQGTRALTTREIDVLRLVADGLSNVQIAEKLGVGPATVKTLLSRSYVKLGVLGRSHAVREATAREWI